MILFVVFGFVIANLRMYQTPLGFETKNQWVAHLDILDTEDSTEVANMKERLLKEIQAMPYIEAASFGCSRTPFRMSMWTTGTDDNGFELFTCLLAGDEYFLETRGLKLLEGRWFTEEDENAKYRPVVVSKKVIEDSFEGRMYLDSIFDFGEEETVGKFCKIIGVVDHYKYFGEFEDEWAASFFYFPHTSKFTSNLNMKVSSKAPPEFEEEVNKTIASISKKSDFVILDLEKRRRENSKGTWVPMVALMSICLFLVLNVALGLFGVLWYNISKRRAEIGLRRTLGASPGRITNQFIWEVMIVTFSGILLGLLFAIQFPILEFFDTENANYYYAMLSAATLILVLVFICSVFPSRQAAGIHPALALHED